MNSISQNASPLGEQSGYFATTHWSVVLQAGETDSPEAADALARLCRAYWYPLYAYVRRQGHNEEDAKDLTQEFFARLLERKDLRRADQNRGRFRTFLLTSLKHFLINEWQQANRQKRGGGCQIISLNAEETETRFRAEPVDDRSPDKAFERRWATILLERVLERLQDEFAAAGRRSVFSELKSFLCGDVQASSYADIGGRLGMSEGSLKVAVHRLRKRYGELLREEVARTVADPAAVEAEMRDLFAALCD